MGVLGCVDRDLPTGVGEGPPSVADSGGSRCPQSAPPGLTTTGEELQADIRGVAVGDHAAPVWTQALPARH